jgi:hypothetical protein
MQGHAWLKRVLIPFWTIDLILFLVIIVIGGLELSAAIYADREDTSSQYAVDDVVYEGFM